MIGQRRVFRALYLAVCLFVMQVAVAAQAPQKEYAENFHEPFKGQPQKKVGDFVLLGADAGQCVKFEPEGLRITLPPGKKRQAIGLATAFGASGDFEITVGYEILQEPEPADAGDGGGTRISLTVNLNKPGTNLIAIRRRVTTTQEPLILTWRSVKKDATSKADELGKTFLVKAKTGRFRFVRTGVDLAYYLSEGADKEFTLLQTFALGADEVKDVQIFASSTSETASLDARFTDLRISAASLPRKPGPAKIEKVSESKIPIKEYAQTYNYSFRGASKISHEYEFSGPVGERYVKLDSAGLHVNLAKGEPAIGSHHGLIANLLIKGDFEITVGFELANEPAPQGDKWGTGISIAVNLDTPEKNRAFLSRVTRWDSKMFGTYVDFWPPGADKPLKPFHSFPAHAAAGRLRIVRSRTQVSYFVSEGADKDFRFLRTDPFRPDDVKQIHITGTVGGPAAYLDAHVIDLHVRADEVTVPHIPAAALPREGRRGWLLAALLLTLIPIAALMLVFFLRKRGGVAAQIPTELARPSVTFKCPNCTKVLKTKPEMAGKKVKCPHCAASVPVPAAEPAHTGRRIPYVVLAVLLAAIVACAIQGYRQSNPGDRLSDEYTSIARALRAGEGFSNPFGTPTGPTAWQPPVLPLLLTGILWVSADDRPAATVVLVCLQAFVLIATGFLVLALCRQTTSRLAPAVIAVVIVLTYLCHFRQCFQFGHDGWLLLLLIDLTIAGLCWYRPFDHWRSAALWGLFGGLCALTNPIAGFTWGVLSLWVGLRRQFGWRIAISLLAAALTLTPWTVRNYLVFSRVLPLKSNLAYELYQSHCLQKEALLQRATFRFHPGSAVTPEGRELRQLGESSYLDKKWQQFEDAVQTDPVDFLERVWGRLMGATLCYEPFHADFELQRPWLIQVSRVTHPLPFFALLVLLGSAYWRPLSSTQWIVVGIYLIYLLPYVVISYYQRYAMPLLGVKILLMLWGMDRILAVSAGLVLYLRQRHGANQTPSQTSSTSQQETDSIGIACPGCGKNLQARVK